MIVVLWWCLVAVLRLDQIVRAVFTITKLQLRSLQFVSRQSEFSVGRRSEGWGRRRLILWDWSWPAGPGCGRSKINHGLRSGGVGGGVQWPGGVGGGIHGRQTRHGRGRIVWGEHWVVVMVAWNYFWMKYFKCFPIVWPDTEERTGWLLLNDTNDEWGWGRRDESEWPVYSTGALTTGLESNDEDTWADTWRVSWPEPGDEW